MNRRHLMVALLGLTTIATACHHKPPATNPGPATNPPPPARGPNADSARAARAKQDSIDAANKAAAAAALQAQEDQARRAALAAASASISAMIHFDYNKAEISPADAQKLDAKVAVLKSHPALRIRITGNCDERGSDDYNIALGTRRAAAAKEYLVKAGIDPSRIDVASLGREKPLDSSHEEGAWSKNRRDEFEVVAGQQSLGSP